MYTRVLVSMAAAATVSAAGGRAAIAQSALPPAGATLQQSTSTNANQALDSLLNTHISSASKYSQTTAEAPSSVTIVTADQIAAYGYRDLAEALEGVRGLYVSSDRNFPYLGVRGFSRPTDYNNRILVLVDGHTINEPMWGSAPVGSDLPINLAAVERIEIVRGPGSALYGANAMFGIINIVTKTGTELNGVQFRAGAGSAGSREAAVVVGQPLGHKGWYSASAIVARSDGWNYYYPELDSPESNNGYSRNQDWENAVGGLASISWGILGARAGIRSRSKGIPTGAYGISLSDTRSGTQDESAWGEVSMRTVLNGAYTLSARAYADQHLIAGTFALGPGPAIHASGKSSQVGGEATLVWDPSSSLRLTLGTEYRDVVRARYHEAYGEETLTIGDAQFNSGAAYAQGSFEVSSALTLLAGVRNDRRSESEAATNPRFAAIVTPDPRTTVKIMYGASYRPPSATEEGFAGTYYAPNPDLRPEHIATLELEIQRRVLAPLLLGASVYSYSVQDLIESVQIESGARLQHENLSGARATGLEFQADWLPGGSHTAHASYALQVATSEPDQLRMTNSPSQIANLQIASRAESGVHSSLALRYESGRRTVSGSRTNSFLRTDVSAGYSMADRLVPGWLRPLDFSLRVTNLLNSSYSVPAGTHHAQSSIMQDGRAWSIRVDWRR